MAIELELVAFCETNELILFIPVAGIPIAGVLFIHSKYVPLKFNGLTNEIVGIA
jgi:hypothetical protein